MITKGDGPDPRIAQLEAINNRRLMPKKTERERKQKEYLERLRDEFAMVSLNAMLQNHDKEGSSRGKNGVKLFAKYAYEYADAMLEAREVQP